MLLSAINICIARSPGRNFSFQGDFDGLTWLKIKYSSAPLIYQTTNKELLSGWPSPAFLFK